MSILKSTAVGFKLRIYFTQTCTCFFAMKPQYIPAEGGSQEIDRVS